jgi:hypothetical protein
MTQATDQIRDKVNGLSTQIDDLRNTVLSVWFGILTLVFAIFFIGFTLENRIDKVLANQAAMAEHHNLTSDMHIKAYEVMGIVEIEREAKND